MMIWICNLETLPTSLYLVLYWLYLHIGTWLAVVFSDVITIFITKFADFAVKKPPSSLIIIFNLKKTLTFHKVEHKLDV